MVVLEIIVVLLLLYLTIGTGVALVRGEKGVDFFRFMVCFPFIKGEHPDHDQPPSDAG